MWLYKTLCLMFTSILLVSSLAGCKEKEGPAERAGKKIDEAVEKMGKEVEKAGDKIKEATEKK